MRREGRVTGYTTDHRRSSADRAQYEQHLEDLGFCGPFNLWELHPRTKLSNKPTNQSKDSSRCKRSACRGCHFHPASKARSKTKGVRNKLYHRKYHGSSRSGRASLPLDPSFFDLHDYNPLSDACDPLYDEDDALLDVNGFHRDMLHVQPAVNPHEHELDQDDDDCSVSGLDMADTLNDDQAMDASRHTDSEAVLSNGVTDTCIHGNLSVCHDHIDDLTIVSTDHLLHHKPLLHCEESLDHEGFLVVCRSLPCLDDVDDDDGSQVESYRLGRSELESDEDDWIIC